MRVLPLLSTLPVFLVFTGLFVNDTIISADTRSSVMAAGLKTEFIPKIVTDLGGLYTVKGIRLALKQQFQFVYAPPYFFLE